MMTTMVLAASLMVLPESCAVANKGTVVAVIVVDSLAITSTGAFPTPSGRVFLLNHQLLAVDRFVNLTQAANTVVCFKNQAALCCGMFLSSRVMDRC